MPEVRDRTSGRSPPPPPPQGWEGWRHPLPPLGGGGVSDLHRKTPRFQNMAPPLPPRGRWGWRHPLHPRHGWLHSGFGNILLGIKGALGGATCDLAEHWRCSRRRRAGVARVRCVSSAVWVCENYAGMTMCFDIASSVYYIN